MAVAGSGGYLPPKKPKKPRGPKPPSSSGSSGSSGSSVTDSTPRGYGSAPASSKAYHKPAAPAYTPPPSYASYKKPKPPSKPKTPSFNEVLSSLGLELDAISKRSSAGADQTEDLGRLLIDPIMGVGNKKELEAPDKSSITPRMSELLQQLKDERESRNKAPEGYTLGAEKLEEGEFAYVPDRFKRTPKKGDGDRLRWYWDLETIKAAREDAFYPSQAEFDINDMMEKQYQDQENWLQNRAEKKVANIRDILYEANQASFKGDFDYLEREHPNLNLKVPKYNEHFGVTPEDMQAQRDEIRAKYKDPYMQDAMIARMKIMRDHFQQLRGSEDSNYYDYTGTQNKIDEAFKKYKKKYNEHVEFALNSPDDKKRSAAEKVHKLDTPFQWLNETEKLKGLNENDRELIDEAGDFGNPNAGYASWEGFFGLPGKNRGANKKAIEKARSHAMGALGTPNLPSVKQMVTYAVRSGELNPEDETAVEAAIDKFRNPNHPDTRAWYVAHVMQNNPQFDAKGKGLAFINEPVEDYLKAEGKRKAGNEAAARDADLNEITGPLDAVSDAWDTMTWQGIPTVDVRPTGGGSGVKGGESNPGALDMNQIGWTFDKLMRFNYAVAGMADTYYGLDKDGGGRNLLSRYSPLGPFVNITGQSELSSIDEIAKNPAAILDIADEGYQQFFRGSSLPGIKDEIVPTTWSHVVANNAARDPENNIYDADWYQHVSGFVLDVATDPLNFIGVGTTAAILNVPKRVTKRLAQAEEAAKAAGDLPTVKNGEILRKLKETSVEGASPQVNFNYRVDQGVRQIGDDLSGVQHKYANDDEFWNSPEINEATEEVANIANQRDALKLQESKLSNDAAIEQLQWQMRELNDEILLADVVSETDFTHWKVMQSTTTKTGEDVLGDMPIRGGAFQTQYIDPLESGAKGTGLYDEVFDDTALGREAQIARDKIARLEDDLELRDMGGNLSPAVQKEISRLNNTIRKAEDAGEVRKVSRVDDYMKDPTFKKPAFDPAAAIARSVGKSKEWLLKAMDLTDEDFHRAVMEGPIQYREADPRAAALWEDGAQRKANYKKQLALPGITKEKIRAATKARNLGLEMQNEVIVEGMMRYLRAAHLMKKSGAPVEVQVMRADVLDKVNKLESLKAQVNQELDLEHGGLSGVHEVDDSGTFLEPNRYYEDTDLTELKLEDILDNSQGFTSKAAQLKAVSDELDAQLEDQYAKLMGEEASAMTLTRSWDAEKLLPKDSMLRNAKGEIDTEKVFGEYLGFSPHNDDVWIKLPDDATAADQAFMETIAGGVRSIYRPTYSIVRTEKLGHAPKGEPDIAPWKPGDPPRKPSANPGPKERALGPRPTADSLRELRNAARNAYKGKGKKPKRYDSEGNELGPGEFEEAYVTFGSKWRKAGEREQIVSKGKITPEDTLRYNRAQKSYEAARKAGDKGKEAAARQEMEGVMLKYNAIVKGEKWEPVPIVERRVVDTGGKRSNADKAADELLERKQREWDKALAKAQDADRKAALDKPQTPEFKQKPTDKVEIAREAFKRAVDIVKSGLKEGRVEPFPGTMRMTINEKAKSAADVVKFQHKLELADLQIAELQAKNAAELRSLRAKRGALTKKRNAQLAKIEAARKEAHDTRIAMVREVEIEHILNLNAMGPEVSKRMLQIHIMGMRKNLQWTHHLWDMAENSAKLVPARFREAYVNNWIRPTKRLDTHEAIHMRARYESLTPVIIHGNLVNAKRRMGGIETPERIKMFEHYRRGGDVEYEGPMMHQYDEAMDEIREIEDIWNQTNSNYWFAPRRGDIVNDALQDHEIYRFLPDLYRPDLKTLHRLTSMEKSGRVTAENLIKAMKVNPLNRAGDMLDPHSFSWTMRLAADQAAAHKSLIHAMESTFGIQMRVGMNAKANVLRTLRDKHGWKPIEGMSKDVIFHPALQNDVKQLLKIAEPGKPQSDFTKLVDTGIGYWKQSMTIYNPGYYTRNGIGEMMVSWLDGVNDPRWYARSYKVHKYAKEIDGPLVKLKKMYPALEGKIPGSTVRGTEKLFTLPKSGYKVTVADVDYWYAQTGLKSTFVNTDLGNSLRGLAVSMHHKGRVRKTANKINEATHEAGEGFEDYLRRAHFMHAMEHSGAGSIERAAYLAAQRVRRSHFDYTDFSPFEKTVMLRAFPFYKWTRRGAPLMFAHLFMTPGKMSALPKAMDTISGLGIDPVGAFNDDPVLSTSDVLDDKNGNLPDYKGIAPGWVRDLWAYQINPAPDDEYQNYFRVQTPQVDGLNSVLNAMPFIGNNDAGISNMFQESGAYPLLNPVAKGLIELPPWSNRSMDPDFPYQIYGGEYNEMNDISPLEAIGTYLARSTNPIAGFLAKMSKNGQLGETLSFGDGTYRDEHGYDGSRDVASFLTGLGFYQGKAMPNEQAGTGADNTAPVGHYELTDLPDIRGRKAAAGNLASDGPTGKTNYRGIMEHVTPQGTDANYAGTERGSGWVDYPDYPQGSGWVNYPDRPWINYGSGYSGGGGYNGYGGDSSSYLSNSGSGGADFAALIEALRRMVDQGQVYDG